MKPERILVVGPPGVGKSWIARRLAAVYALPHVELDGFKLKPSRRLASNEDFVASLRAAIEADRWLLDGNWSDDDLAAEVWGRADLVVWLDFPRPVVMRQVIRRSVRRLVTREDYYGWTERVWDWISPTHPIRWSWKMVHSYRERYATMTARRPAGTYARLGSRSAANAFVASAAAS